MKNFLLSILLSFASLSVLGQTPRTSLTGIIIDGAHANQPLGIVVTPNPQVWLSDELIQDKDFKWKAWIPVIVWRQRKVLGEYRFCPVYTFMVEVNKNGSTDDLKPQMFVVPASLVHEFDHFLFEYRPWYSISTTASSPPGSSLVLPVDPSAVEAVGALASRFPINCSESPRVSTQHVRLFKE